MMNPNYVWLGVSSGVLMLAACNPSVVDPIGGGPGGAAQGGESGAGRGGALGETAGRSGQSGAAHGGALNVSAGGDAESGWLSPTGEGGTAGIGGAQPFVGAVTESFAGERFHKVWGTNDEVWILGDPDPGPTASGSGGSMGGPCDGAAAAPATTILRRKTDGDFVPMAHPASTYWMSALHGSSGSDVWMVGYAGAVFQFDGSAWHAHDIRSAQDLAFNEVACAELALSSVFARSPTDVWVVGYIYESPAGPGLILHFDGLAWRRDVVDAADGFFGVWASSATDAWAVGASGITYHYDGLVWQSVSAASDQYLYAVLGTQANDVWVIGNRSIASHYDGNTWQLLAAGEDYSTSDALAGNLEGGIWTLKQTGTTPALDHWRQSLSTWDGQAWQVKAYTSNTKRWLRDMYMLPNGQLWAVGNDVVRFR